MLTRQNDVAPSDKYYADSLLTKPTIGQSVFDNLAAGFATPIVAINMLDSQFAQQPEGRAIRSALDTINLESQTPGIGTGHWLADEGANMLGFGLNPVTWGFGEAGGLAAKGVSAAAGRAIPDAASIFIRKPLKELVSKPIANYVPSALGEKSVGLLSDKTLSTFGTFAGAGVPQGIVDNFNNDTGHISWGGVARESGEMGAFGLAIGSIPFAWGLLRGKINRGLGEAATTAITQDKLNLALEKGSITPDEHKWYSDYLEHQKNPEDVLKTEELKDRASQIINQNGHTANTASNEAQFQILQPKDIDNLHGAISDQLSGNVPDEYKEALSQYMVNNRMDNIRDNPNALDGVRGYVDFVNDKLANKDEKLNQADEILDNHLTRSVKENMPFSQKEIFKMMKQANFESSHLQHLPMTVPENIARRLADMNEVSELKKENVRLERKNLKVKNQKYISQIKDRESRIGFLQKNIDTYEKLINKPEETKSHVSDLQQRINKYKLDIASLREKDKLVKSGKRYLEKIKKNEDRIANLENNSPKLLTPKEELSNLRRKILGEKGLPKKFELSKDYHRLLDLSNVWHNARTLLDRIHLEHEYNKQEAFRDLAQHTLNVADSNLPKMANPENVTDYLKRRIEGTLSQVEPVAKVEAIVKERRQVPADSDTILTEQEARIQKTQAVDAKEEFQLSSSRYKEFKVSDGIFKNLISCVLGAANG
jgi:hypothetical protein